MNKKETNQPIQMNTGLVRLPDKTVVKDPDDQVRHVIELVLAQFEVLGGIYQVTSYLRHQKIRLPRRQASGQLFGQLVWKVASEAAVSAILQNPAYAGTFVYGRRQKDPTQRQPGRPYAGQLHKPMSEWIHIQHDLYPAYISWDQYLANQERIRQNGLRFVENIQKSQGIVRRGPGLLQGMVVCGTCTHHMYVTYKQTTRYLCRSMVRTAGADTYCKSVQATIVDDAVIQMFFEAIRPAQF